MAVYQYVWGTERPNAWKARHQRIANEVAKAAAAEAKRVYDEALARIAKTAEQSQAEVDFVEQVLDDKGRYCRAKAEALKGIAGSFEPVRRPRGRPRKYGPDNPRPPRPSRAKKRLVVGRGDASPSNPSDATSVRERGERRSPARTASRSPARQPVPRPSAAPEVGGALMQTTTLSQARPKKAKGWEVPFDLSDVNAVPDALRAVFPYAGLPTELSYEDMTEEQRVAWLNAAFPDEPEFVEKNVAQRGSLALIKQMHDQFVSRVIAAERARIKAWPLVRRRTEDAVVMLAAHEKGDFDREELYDRTAQDDYELLAGLDPEVQKALEDALRAPGWNWPEGLSRPELVARAGGDPDRFEPVLFHDRRRIIPLWRETGYGLHGLTNAEKVARARQLAERGRRAEAPDTTFMEPADYLAFLMAAGGEAAVAAMSREAFQAFMATWDRSAPAAPVSEPSGEDAALPPVGDLPGPGDGPPDGA